MTVNRVGFGELVNTILMIDVYNEDDEVDRDIPKQKNVISLEEDGYNAAFVGNICFWNRLKRLTTLALLYVYEIRHKHIKRV